MKHSWADIQKKWQMAYIPDVAILTENANGFDYFKGFMIYLIGFFLYIRELYEETTALDIKLYGA